MLLAKEALSVAGQQPTLMVTKEGGLYRGKNFIVFELFPNTPTFQ